MSEGGVVSTVKDPSVPSSAEEVQTKRKKGRVKVKKRIPQKPGISRTQRRKAKKEAKEEAMVESVKESLSAVRHDSSDLIIVSAVIDGRHCKDVLIDPGATSNFIHKNWAQGKALRMQKLSKPLEVTLGDGKTTRGGRLTHAVQVASLSTQGSEASCTLTVMDELSHQVIVGMPWIRKAGVTIDFKKMKWNGRSLYMIGDQKKEGPARLQSLTVASGHEARMAAILKDYPKAFSTELRERSAADIERAVKCRIQLKDPNCRPVKSRERRRSPKDIATLKTIVEEMLAKGLVRHSESEWAAQPVMVKKVKDGVELEEKRPCWDYRRPNDLIKGDAFPLPLPENMFDALQGSRMFSKLDLTKGFWQIPLDEASKAILAMSTPIGLVEPNTMPFGMKNAPSVFQREMQRVFRVRLGKGVFVFIDDILLYTKTVEEHEELVRWVLKRLCDEGYYANPDKCEFFQKEVSFLGHVINEKGLSVQQHKVKAVAGWPVPTTVKEVRGFLGLTNYYRKFVPNYAKIAVPLTEMTKQPKNSKTHQNQTRKFEWGKEQQQAFEELKSCLMSAPVLAHPDPSRQYILNTDASGFAVGGVLSQQQADGSRRPVAYFSHKMTPTERNYTVPQQELLAIVQAVQHWRCYLEGNPYPTKIITDHQGLQWLNTQAELNGRQARWVEALSDIEFQVEYVPGPQNAAADALSRRVDLQPSVAAEVVADAPQRPRLKLQLGAIPTVTEVPMWEVRSKSVPFLAEIKKAAAADPWYAGKLAEIAPSDGLVRGEGLLWTDEGILWVPDDLEIRRKLLFEMHDAPTGGHLGVRKTIHKMQEQFWWLGMRKDIEDYVRGCVVCASTKASQQLPTGLLHPLPIPSRPWETISIDFVGPLPRTSDYYDFILVIIDKFTKMAHFVPTTTNVTAAKTAKLLIQNAFKLHGLPQSILSDRDPRFTAKVWQEIFKAWGTELKMSSSYHPQTNAQSERLNRTLEAGLRAYAQRTKTDWATWLPMVEAFYNSSVHESTGKTPFEMNGTKWSDATTLAVSCPSLDHVRSQGAEDVLKGMKSAWEDARQMMIHKRETMKRNADRLRREEVYLVGERVMLSTKDLAKGRAKLDDRFTGPFTITRVGENKVNVWLDLPAEYSKLHQPFHVSRVKRYTPSTIEWGRKQEDRPLSDLVDGAPEWEVEAITGKREEMETVEETSLEDAGDPDYGDQKEEKKEDVPITVRRSARLIQKGKEPSVTRTLKKERPPVKVKKMVLRYRVKWKRYPEEESTWERVENLSNAREAIEEYERQQADMRGEEIMGVHYLHTWVKGAQGDGVTLHTVMVGTRSHPGFRSVLSGTSSGVVHSSQK
jgi:transposase InsO family protein